MLRKNGGQASAFNFGFAHARGEIVVLLDADDYFLPGKLSRILDEFRKHPEVGTIYHRLMERHSDSEDLRSPRFPFNSISGFLPDDPGKLMRFSPHQTSCLAFRRTVVDPVLPVPQCLRIQADAFIEMLTVLRAPVLALSETLAVYRIHGSNLSYSDWANSDPAAMDRRVSSYMLVLAAVKQWIKQHRDDFKGIDTDRYVNLHIYDLRKHSFVTRPPSRLDYFTFLVVNNYLHSPIQSLKYTLFNYLSAPLALVLGYRRSHSIYEQVLRRLQSTQRQ